MQSLKDNTKKPKLILTPFSPLMRKNHSHSINIHPIPTTEAFSLPFLPKQRKVKTEPSETHESPTHLRTHTSPDLPSDQSASSRLLSRLIYTHLKKKITIQQQTFRDVKTNNLGPKTEFDHLPALDNEEFIFTKRNKKYQGHVYAYEKSLKTHSNYTQHLRYRNRLPPQIRHAQGRTDTSEDTPNVSKINSAATNIDAYFDLSCLQTCKARHTPANASNL